MNYRFGQVVKAWLGQADEPFLTIFTESNTPPDTVNYSTQICKNTWVRPSPIHVTHVKRIELITRH
jgi:hypothetical protein